MLTFNTSGFGGSRGAFCVVVPSTTICVVNTGQPYLYNSLTTPLWWVLTPILSATAPQDFCVVAPSATNCVILTGKPNNHTPPGAFFHQYLRGYRSEWHNFDISAFRMMSSIQIKLMMTNPLWVFGPKRAKIAVSHILTWDLVKTAKSSWWRVTLQYVKYVVDDFVYARRFPVHGVCLDVLLIDVMCIISIMSRNVVKGWRYTKK